MSGALWSAMQRLPARIKKKFKVSTGKAIEVSSSEEGKDDKNPSTGGRKKGKLGGGRRAIDESTCRELRQQKEMGITG